jgi:hypothetical protein
MFYQKLKAKVLPLQSTQNRKIVRIFGMKEEELDIIKSAYEKPSMFPETHVTSRSQGGRTEDRGLGSCTQMDVKYEFDTKEGLHVKLYRMRKHGGFFICAFYNIQFLFFHSKYPYDFPVLC